MNPGTCVCTFSIMQQQQKLQALQGTSNQSSVTNQKVFNEFKYGQVLFKSTLSPSNYVILFVSESMQS